MVIDMKKFIKTLMNQRCLKSNDENELKCPRNKTSIVLRERTFKTVIQVLFYFLLQRFVEEIFKFELVHVWT